MGHKISRHKFYTVNRADGIPGLYKSHGDTSGQANARGHNQAKPKAVSRDVDSRRKTFQPPEVHKTPVNNGVIAYHKIDVNGNKNNGMLSKHPENKTRKNNEIEREKIVKIEHATGSNNLISGKNSHQNVLPDVILPFKGDNIAREEHTIMGKSADSVSNKSSNSSLREEECTKSKPKIVSLEVPEEHQYQEEELPPLPVFEPISDICEDTPVTNDSPRVPESETNNETDSLKSEESLPSECQKVPSMFDSKEEILAANSTDECLPEESEITQINDSIQDSFFAPVFSGLEETDKLSEEKMRKYQIADSISNASKSTCSYDDHIAELVEDIIENTCKQNIIVSDSENTQGSLQSDIDMTDTQNESSKSSSIQQDDDSREEENEDNTQLELLHKQKKEHEKWVTVDGEDVIDPYSPRERKPPGTSILKKTTPVMSLQAEVKKSVTYSPTEAPESPKERAKVPVGQHVDPRIIKQRISQPTIKVSTGGKGMVLKDIQVPRTAHNRVPEMKSKEKVHAQRVPEIKPKEKTHVQKAAAATTNTANSQPIPIVATYPNGVVAYADGTLIQFDDKGQGRFIQKNPGNPTPVHQKPFKGKVAKNGAPVSFVPDKTHVASNGPDATDARVKPRRKDVFFL